MESASLPLRFQSVITAVWGMPHVRADLFACHSAVKLCKVRAGRE